MPTADLKTIDDGDRHEPLCCPYRCANLGHE
ncbi:MAG: hypothetical protein ACI9AQ_000499, partial [Dinoroseobacter sp.]